MGPSDGVGSLGGLLAGLGGESLVTTSAQILDELVVYVEEYGGGLGDDHARTARAWAVGLVCGVLGALERPDAKWPQHGRRHLVPLVRSDRLRPSVHVLRYAGAALVSVIDRACAGSTDLVALGSELMAGDPDSATFRWMLAVLLAHDAARCDDIDALDHWARELDETTATAVAEISAAVERCSVRAILPEATPDDWDQAEGFACW